MKARHILWPNDAPPNHGGILNDREISALAAEGMIIPFLNTQQGKPSYGLGSFGYDLRLGKKFLVPIGGVSVVLDPVNFPQEHFRVIVEEEEIIIAPGSQILAESVENFDIPEDVTGVCWGKSSYARCGVLVNVTPLEAGWKGILTLELANLSPLPIRLHVGQGIAQVVFFYGERPKRTYAEKEAGGVYQNQSGVTLPR